MKRLFETAETLIFDPVASNRNATRASLYTLGFRKVEVAPTLEMLQQRLRDRAPDLLLAEITGSEAEACAAIQAIRQGQAGDNPFVVIVATTWRRDGTAVGQVLNSGADDLIARPVSTTVLRERIRGLAERRKDFVVTSDYIGPDRRREARADSAPCIAVPNPLALRGQDALTEAEAERAIFEAVQQGRITLNLQKLRRDSVHLCVQLRILEQRRPAARDFRGILPRIGFVAAEMKRRAAAIGRADALKPCELVCESVQTMMASPEKLDENGGGPVFSVLGHAILTLGHIFAPDEVEPDGLVDLDVVQRRPRPAAA